MEPSIVDSSMEFSFLWWYFIFFKATSTSLVSGALCFLNLFFKDCFHVSFKKISYENYFTQIIYYKQTITQMVWILLQNQLNLLLCLGKWDTSLPEMLQLHYTDGV